MPSENVTLSTNIGSGAVMRTLADANSNQWIPSVSVYATSVDVNGVSTFQFAGVNAGLPVAQQGPWTVAANQNGAWVVTANAGTNLNTGALALEAGGNLAAINGKLPVLGQAVAAASVPVVLTAAQVTTLMPLSTVTVTGTFWQAIQTINGNTNTNASQAGAWNITNANLVNAVTSITNPVTVANNGTFAVQASQGGTWNIVNASLVNSVSVVNAVTGITNTVVVNGTVNATQSGAWNVANTNLVNTVTAVTAITNALPAGTNLIGHVSSSGETNTIYEGTTALTPMFAFFNLNTNGATTVINGVSNKAIRVVRWTASANAACNLYWQSNTNAVQISGIRYMTQYATAGGAYTVVGHFQTANSDSLQANASTNGPVSGELTYVLA